MMIRKNFLIGSLMLLSVFGTTKAVFADSLDKYVESLPGHSLITNELKIKGVTFRDFHFANGKKYIAVEPNQTFDADISFDVDSHQLETFDFHHFIVGLYNEQAQDTVVQSLGLMDRHDKTTVSFKAPAKKGVYQVRICYGKGLTFENAKKYWNKEGEPSSASVVGLVIVK